jgi:ASC-1-like (ASCH) protein
MTIEGKTHQNRTDTTHDKEKGKTRENRKTRTRKQNKHKGPNPDYQKKTHQTTPALGMPVRCLLLQRKYLIMMGTEIKDLEARAGPGYNNGVANIAVGDMVRFQAGNGPDNFGSEHILAEVMERRKHRHAGAMLKAEPLERLVGPGVTMPQALQIYCGVSTRRWTNLDISPSQDATHRAHATAMLGESPSALEKWLRERGIRPKKYRKEEMQQAMRTIAAQGVVGMLRDTASPRPDPTEWDKDFKASKDTYFIVWALAIRKIRIHGFTPNPSPPPTKTTPPTARPPSVAAVCVGICVFPPPPDPSLPLSLSLSLSLSAWGACL